MIHPSLRVSSAGLEEKAKKNLPDVGFISNPLQFQNGGREEEKPAARLSSHDPGNRLHLNTEKELSRSLGGTFVPLLREFGWI